MNEHIACVRVLSVTPVEGGGAHLLFGQIPTTKMKARQFRFIVDAENLKWLESAIVTVRNAHAANEEASE